MLIIAKCLEDALHGFIADGLLGLFVGGLPGHADSHSFWGEGHQLRLQPHGLKIRDRIFRGARETGKLETGWGKNSRSNF